MEEIVGIVSVTNEAMPSCIGGVKPVVDDGDSCIQIVFQHRHPRVFVVAGTKLAVRIATVTEIFFQR